MIQRILAPQPEPEIDLASAREEMEKLHEEILLLTERALRKAIRLGGMLVQLQRPLKSRKEYEDWINTKLPFSARTARDYVTLYRNREMIEHESSADSLSIRAALKLIADSAKAATPPATDCCPEEIEVEVEEVQEDDEVRLADRAVLMVEAETGFIDQLIALIRAGKQAGKDIEYQKIGAFEADVPLKKPFCEMVGSHNKAGAPRQPLKHRNIVP